MTYYQLKFLKNQIDFSFKQIWFQIRLFSATLITYLSRQEKKVFLSCIDTLYCLSDITQCLTYHHITLSTLHILQFTLNDNKLSPTKFYSFLICHVLSNNSFPVDLFIDFTLEFYTDTFPFLPFTTIIFDQVKNPVNAKFMHGYLEYLANFLCLKN